MESSRTNTDGRVRLVRPLLFLLVVVAGGCAVGTASDPFDEAANMDTYLLRVESRNLHDVTIYANPGGRRRLVGVVRSNGMEFFEFEYPAMRPVNLELETRVGENYRLPGLPAPGGSRLDLIIEREIRRSGFVRRSPE